ncbi:MAG: alpha/beta fold hydrolase, partial [Flammeovirgaceae bacterium]
HTANKTTDFETITKDEAWRKTITTGSFKPLTKGYTYYEFSNPQADTTVVLVHGFSVPSFIWASTFRAATQRGYATLRYDNFGRGYSDNPDVVYDVALFSGQLKELMDSLHLTRPVTLVGLSDGGRTITHFAANFPARVQNLVYVDAVGFETMPDSPPVIVTEKEIAEFKSSDNYGNMAKGQLSDFYDSVPFKGWDKKYETLMQFRGFVRALISTRSNRSNLAVQHQKITEAQLPVYAIWGEHDTVVVLNEIRESMLARLPNIQLSVIPKAGHLPHMEQTKQFNYLLLNQVIAKRNQEKTNSK